MQDKLKQLQALAREKLGNERYIPISINRQQYASLSRTSRT